MKRVTYAAVAAKALKKHDNMAQRIRKALNEYATDQTAHANQVTRLVGSPFCRLRVGDFRVIFEESAAEIQVLKIGPRGDVYEEL